MITYVQYHCLNSFGSRYLLVQLKSILMVVEYGQGYPASYVLPLLVLPSICSMTVGGSHSVCHRTPPSVTEGLFSVVLTRNFTQDIKYYLIRAGHNITQNMYICGVEIPYFYLSHLDSVNETPKPLIYDLPICYSF